MFLKDDRIPWIVQDFKRRESIVECEKKVFPKCFSDLKEWDIVLVRVVQDI